MKKIKVNKYNLLVNKCIFVIYDRIRHCRIYINIMYIATHKIHFIYVNLLCAISRFMGFMSSIKMYCMS